MDVGSVDCVSLPDAAPTDVDGAAALGLASRVHPKAGVHELLECPVCTNSMFPPIHQVLVHSHHILLFHFQMGIWLGRQFHPFLLLGNHCFVCYHCSASSIAFY
jgi:hypothetical protein